LIQFSCESKVRPGTAGWDWHATHFFCRKIKLGDSVRIAQPGITSLQNEFRHRNPKLRVPPRTRSLCQFQFRWFRLRPESLPTLRGFIPVMRGLANDVADLTNVVDAIETQSQHALEEKARNKTLNAISVFLHGQRIFVRVLREGSGFNSCVCHGGNGLRFQIE
jgi:hypothetical protein